MNYNDLIEKSKVAKDVADLCLYENFSLPNKGDWWDLFNRMMIYKALELNDLYGFYTETQRLELLNKVDSNIVIPGEDNYVDYFTLSYIYTTNQAYLYFKLPAGKNIIIDWGDGSTATKYYGQGSTLITVHSNYISANTYIVVLYNDFEDITYLDIHNQTFDGDISGVSAWLNIETLILASNAAIDGVITTWNVLTKLKYLNLTGTSVTGVVTGWSGMNSLEEINISGTSLTGSIAGWIVLTKLKNVDISTTAITGSITGLSVLVNLEEFVITASSVTGIVTGFSACTKMRIFNAYGMVALTGSITNFMHCIDMTYLNMEGCTSITGSIAGFALMTDLEYLNLYETLVTGDISGLISCTKLTELRLTDCNITATLMAWSNWDSIVTMHLGGTGVTGDVNYIAECEHLQTVVLGGTAVSYGDLGGGKVWDKTDLYLDCSSCGWTSDEVDDCLIDLAVTPIQDSFILIAGTNAARTGASDAAKVILLANGNTVTINE
jgi:predicted membrane protein